MLAIFTALPVRVQAPLSSDDPVRRGEAGVAGALDVDGVDLRVLTWNVSEAPGV